VKAPASSLSLEGLWSTVLHVIEAHVDLERLLLLVGRARRLRNPALIDAQASGDDHVLLRVGRDCRLPSPDAGRALIMRPALIDAHAAAETVRCRARAYSLYIGFYGRWPEIVAG
jgi:hypothetical protein